ncbi:hypothetical protein BDQ17DRAFT_1332711 [Cyathus striatus]|nr:hypothetical protein BDQ17DRAFT_1332711 [Cyathus striatus]
MPDDWDLISPLIIDARSFEEPVPFSGPFSQLGSGPGRYPPSAYGGGGAGPSSYHPNANPYPNINAHAYQHAPPASAPAWTSSSHPEWPPANLAGGGGGAGGRVTPYPPWASEFQPPAVNVQGRPGATPFRASASLHSSSSGSSRGATPQVPPHHYQQQQHQQQQQAWWGPAWPSAGGGGGGGATTPQTSNTTPAGSFGPLTPAHSAQHPSPYIVNPQAQFTNPYFPPMSAPAGIEPWGGDLVRSRSTTGKKARQERRRAQSVSGPRGGGHPGLVSSATFPPPGSLLSSSGYPAPTPPIPPGQGQAHIHTQSLSQTSAATYQNFYAPQVSPTSLTIPFSPPAAGYPPAYALPDEFNERNLAKRPRDWRADYDPRGGLVPGVVSMFPRLRKGMSDVHEYTDPLKRTIHPLLAYTPSHPPIYHDLRFSPFPSTPSLTSSTQPLGSPSEFTNLEFPNIQRKPNSLDLAQLACTPSASLLRLYHPKLPWYIDIHASHPNGVTVYDVLMQMQAQLKTKISARHYWNDVLAGKDREGVNRAFLGRCGGREEEVREGVRQVDFLGGAVVLRGFSRGRGGMWEVRTSEAE